LATMPGGGTHGSEKKEGEKNEKKKTGSGCS